MFLSCGHINTNFFKVSNYYIYTSALPFQQWSCFCLWEFTWEEEKKNEKKKHKQVLILAYMCIYAWNKETDKFEQWKNKLIYIKNFLALVCVHSMGQPLERIGVWVEKFHLPSGTNKKRSEKNQTTKVELRLLTKNKHR